MTNPVYISITGLQLRHFWQAPLFWWHAAASMSQAQQAEGCLDAAARTINGIHHTRSVWQNKEAMLAYLRAGAHLKAMKAFHTMATGKTVGFLATEIPDWEEVHRRWSTEGRDV